MKRICLTLFCLCAFAPVLAKAASDFKDWKWKRSILVHETTGFVRVPISPEIFNDSQLCLEDLRVIDDANRLVPHVLQWDYSAKGTGIEWRPAKLLNGSRIDRKYSRIVADFGRIEEKNAVQVSTSGTNFRRRVELEGSNDSARWEKLPGVFLLFDVTIRGQQQKLDTLALPLNNFRFLRLTVFNMPDESEPIAIETVKCTSRKVIAEKNLIAVPAKSVSITHGKDGRETLIHIDMGFRNLPIDRMRIRIDDPYFHRGFSISASNTVTKEGENQKGSFQTKTGQQAEPMRYLNGGIFYRIRDKEGSSESLLLEDVHMPYRYLSLRIYNGDSPPLRIAGVDLWRGATDLIFEAKKGRSYTLLGGNEAARQPDYDLASSMRDLNKSGLPVASLGEKTSKDQKEKAPWTERHGTLILIVLIALAASIAYLILRSMRSLPKEG